jgi:predicted dehydrogenase
MIGINGFGQRHFEAVKRLMEESKITCAAFSEVKPNVESENYKFLIERGAAHYTDYREMLKSHPDMSFVTVATPIHLHKPMAIDIMKAGMNVYLEKPPAVLIQELDEMIEVEKSTGKICVVGFQYTSGEAFLRLKRMLANNEFGKISRVYGKGLRKRTDKYYARTAWAGKQIYNGRYVLDGTIFNALSHLLNNCLIAAGGGNPLNASPKTVKAELYKSRDIKGEDTACIDILTENGVKVNFYSTLTNLTNDSPTLTVCGEKGAAVWDFNGNKLKTVIDGKEENYAPEEDGSLVYKMMSNLIENIDNGAPLYSPLSYSRPFVLAGNCSYISFGSPKQIPEEYVDIYRDDPEWKGRTVKGIRELIDECAESGFMYSDVNKAWAVPGKTVDASKVKEF